MRDHCTELIQIRGVIKSLHYRDQQEVNWWNYRRSILYGAQNFETTCFSAQIEQYLIVGQFTQLVFSEGDEVEVILKPIEHSQEFHVLALQHKQILHLMPELHTDYLYVDPNQHVPKWMLIVALLVTLASWKSLGVGAGLICGFSVLVVIAFGWILYKQLRGRWKKFLLNRQLFAMPMLKQLSLSKASQSHYWYRMKEFVIDLNLVKK